MNEELYEKLSVTIYDVGFRKRVIHAFEMGGITNVIGIYRYQVNHGGHPRSPNSCVGIKMLEKFGKDCYAEVVAKLKGLCLPELSKASRILMEYDAFKSSGCDRPTTRRILECMLLGLGKKHDPHTLNQIMAVID